MTAAGAKPDHPFVFVVGCGRSGTTLLRAMLNAHPDLAVPAESYFIVPMDFERTRRYELPTGFAQGNFVDDLMRYPSLRSWGISEEELRSEVASCQPSNLAQAIRCLYAL